MIETATVTATATATTLATVSSYPYAMTLEAVGEKLGISRHRVQQIEQKALRKMRLSRMTELLAMRPLASELQRSRDNAGAGHRLVGAGAAKAERIHEILTRARR